MGRGSRKTTRWKKERQKKRKLRDKRRAEDKGAKG